jgi:hypothetical protein
MSGDPISSLPPFFSLDGDRFVPSVSARGPWSPRHQHGGPPAALLARAFERQAPPGVQIARLTFDFLRPVPLAPLTVATRVVRAGAKVQRLAGALLAEDGAPVVEATCLSMRVASASVTVATEGRPMPAPPTEATRFELPLMHGDQGYHRAVEWRIARGTWGEGPVAAWLRLRVSLVAGEAPTPLQSLATIADSASGIALTVDPRHVTFVNGDLTIALHRAPVGEWICLDAATTGETHGIGLTRARLWDTTGLIGRSFQTLLLERRESP